MTKILTTQVIKSGFNYTTPSNLSRWLLVGGSILFQASIKVGIDRSKEAHEALSSDETKQTSLKPTKP